MSRNEPARQRHRRTLKRDQSVSSLPMDSKPKELNLKNHFGWMTVQKCQVGDGNIPQYPQIVQYHENPERDGPDYKKLTYIMYLKGKADSLGNQEKEIQTMAQRSMTMIQPTVNSKPPKTKEKTSKDKTPKDKAPKGKASKEKVPKEKAPAEKAPVLDKAPPKGKQQVVEVTEKKETVRKEEVKLSPSMESKRRRLIDSFYYKKRESGDNVFKPIDNEAFPESNPVVVENYTTDYVPDKKKKKADKGRGSPKSWQLRSEAGADSVGSFVVHHIGEIRESDEDMYVMTGGQWDNKYQMLRERERERERSRSRSERDNQYLYLTRQVKSRAPRECS